MRRVPLLARSLLVRSQNLVNEISLDRKKAALAQQLPNPHGP
jgi:hypothetical protein